jgi:hypothetical protein
MGANLPRTPGQQQVRTTRARGRRRREWRGPLDSGYLCFFLLAD